MKTLMHCLKNETGSIMVMAVFVVILLTIIGFAATRTSVTELQIVRNVIESKQDFYTTEGSIFIVAADVDQGAVDPDDDGDLELEFDYQITDISSPSILTKTSNVSTPSNDDDYHLPPMTQTSIGYNDTNWGVLLDSYTDDKWPTSSDGEYAFRVYYKGQGASPKGTGTDFGTYIFDIAVRKVKSDGSYSSIINKGHKKIGPKN